MSVILGNFIEKSSKIEEELDFDFSISELPFNSQWWKNSLFSEFIGDYFLKLLETKEVISLGNTRHVYESLVYIANELLENALKYSNHNPYKISISSYICQDKIVLIVRNFVTVKYAEKYQEYIRYLQKSDLLEVYRSKIEKNMETNDSGLGLLTIMNDEQVVLGWKFEEFFEEKAAFRISTMAQISLRIN